MINDFLSSLKAYAKNNKKIVVIICVIWVVLILFVGVVMGISSRDAIMTLSPEEENNRAIKMIKGDTAKIEQGIILTPQKNLSLKQIELAKDYAGKSKIRKQNIN